MRDAAFSQSPLPTGYRLDPDPTNGWLFPRFQFSHIASLHCGDHRANDECGDNEHDSDGFGNGRSNHCSHGDNRAERNDGGHKREPDRQCRHQYDPERIAH